MARGLMLILLCLLLLTGAACAEPVAVVCGVTEPSVPLYAGPSDQTDLVGYIFPGAEAELTDEGSGYAHLKLDALDGWVTAEHIAKEPGALLTGGLEGSVRPCGSRRYRSLLASPDEAAEVRATLAVYVPLRVSASSVTCDWLLVTLSDGLRGWLQPQDVRTDGAIRYVDASSPADRLHLRTRATSRSASMGTYFAGTEVEVLADSLAVEGWLHVAVLDCAGWMKADYLREDLSRWLPPLTATDLTADIRLFATPDSATAELTILRPGTLVELDGIFGRYAHVRLQDGSSGWVLTSALTELPEEAAPSSLTLAETVLLRHEDGSLAAGVPAGKELRLLEGRPWAVWWYQDGAMQLVMPETVRVRYQGAEALMDAALVW